MLENLLDPITHKSSSPETYAIAQVAITVRCLFGRLLKAGVDKPVHFRGKTI